MKAVTIVPLMLLATISAVMVFSVVSNHGQAVPQDIIAKYQVWQAKFGKLYATPSESHYRLKVFADSCALVDSDNDSYNRNLALLNEPPVTAPMFEINQFSDLTEAEFIAQYTGAKLPDTLEVLPEAPEALETNLASAPVNLGQTAYQYRVRDQGSCGSCWAFSTIAQVEKLYFDYNRSQIDFSQRELVDCDSSNFGCSGGWPQNALKYIISNGINTSSAYPYHQGTNQYCQRKAGSTRFTGIASKAYNYARGYAAQTLGKGAVLGLLVYASKGFSSVSSSSDTYNPRAAGECGLGMNHAIVATRGTGDYHTIQNSWNTRWGQGGSKNIKPCSDTEFYGTPSQLVHAYAAY